MTRRISRRISRLGLAWLACLSGAVTAHEVVLDMTMTPAAVLQLRYADGQPFAFEAYELYPGTADMPAQVGRTDAQGRLAFLPDGQADWRLKAFAADGHGLDRRLHIAPTGATAAASTAEAGLDHFARVILGLALILGGFGLYQRYRSKQRKSAP